MSNFSPKPLPLEDLTAAMRRGMADVPRTTVPVPPLEPPAPEPNDNVEPPLRAAPPADVAKRFTSFRLPVTLDEDLRAMMFETRRSKQDLLIEFVTEGVRAWRRDRAGRR